MTRQFPAPQKDGISSSSRVIYLTFDNGPYAYTQRLLEVLDRYHVKATFFVTDRINHLDILPKIAVASHSIGNHTANHNYETLYASEGSFVNALEKMEEIILDQAGLRPTLFRFPGGSASIHSHSRTMAWRAG